MSSEFSWTCPACKTWTIDEITPGFVSSITEHMRKCAAAPAFVRETAGHMPPPSLIDCNSPVAVCLEDAREVAAFHLVEPELADFKRAVVAIGEVLSPLPLDAARRVLVAAAKTVGFSAEIVADFERGMDIGIAEFVLRHTTHRGDPPS